MILAFIGISVALYGGLVLAGTVQAWHRPFMFLALTGEPLSWGILQGLGVASAVMVGAGYGVLRIGLSGIV